MPDPVFHPDPTDPTKDQDPTPSEAAQNSASDEHELTDEQLEKAAGGITNAQYERLIDSPGAPGPQTAADPNS